MGFFTRGLVAHPPPNPSLHKSAPLDSAFCLSCLGCAQDLSPFLALLLPSADTRMTHGVERRELGRSGAEWLKGLDRHLSGEDAWPGQEKS